MPSDIRINHFSFYSFLLRRRYRPVLRMFVFLLLATYLLLLPFAYAEDVTEILKPNYRTADELQPILQNIFSGKVKIQSFNNKLIVTGLAGNVEEVKKALQKLDQKPQNIFLELKRVEFGLGEGSSYGASGQIILKKNTAGVRINPRQARSGEGVSVGARSGQSRIEANANETRQNNAGQILSSIIVMAGGEGVLRSPEDGLTQTWKVKPRVQGRSVNLEIQSQKEYSGNFPPPISGSSGINTNVSGGLGDWIEIGRSRKQSATRESGILNKSQNRSESEYVYFIRAKTYSR